MCFHREEREVLLGTRKEGNVVTERKGRILSDGKEGLSARKKGGGRKGRVEKGAVYKAGRGQLHEIKAHLN